MTAGGLDEATLEVRGETLSTWTTYSIESDIRQPSDGFRFDVSIGGRGDAEAVRRRRELRELLSPGAPVRVWIARNGTRDRALQLTGTIEELNARADRTGGTTFAVQGRDLAGYLVDASVAIDLIRIGSKRELTFADVARAAVEPWGIEVVTDPTAARDTWLRRRAFSSDQRRTYDRARALGIVTREFSPETATDRQAFAAGLTPEQARFLLRASKRYANGLPPSRVETVRVPDMRPFPGETVWSFLARHAQRLRLMMWFSPDGKLVIGSPDYATAPVHRIVRRYQSDPGDPNNVIEGGATWQIADRYSSVTVYGRAPRGNLARARVAETATDATWPAQVKPLVSYDSSIRSDAEARDRAQRELARFAVEGEVLEYVVPGHGQGAALYAIDTCVEVLDEVVGARGPYYVIARTFEKSRQNGTTTRLRLIPPGALTL